MKAAGERSEERAAGSPGLLIWDCDGTLVDSERLALRVDAVVLARLGWPLSEDEIARRFLGSSRAHWRAEVEAHLGRPLADDWEEPFAPLYEKAFRDELAPVEGVVAALDRIAADGGPPMCVASNSGHRYLRRVLTATGLQERFEGRVFSADDVATGKPAPDLFLYAAARSGVAPARCVVVEDSPFGVAAARAAGMRVLAFAGGPTPPERLAGPGTVVFRSMAEVPGLLR